jgi:hypothetical protein
MPTDGDTDYRTYTRAELEEAIRNIDAARYPTNYANLRAEVDARINGASREPALPDNYKIDATIGFLVDMAIAGMVVLYTVIGALTGDLVIPSLSGRHSMHLAGVAAWIAMVAALLVAIAIALGGLDTSDPPRIRPKFRWAFRLAGITLGVAACWQLIGPGPK